MTNSTNYVGPHAFLGLEEDVTDFSNYALPFTPALLAGLWADGVRTMILGTQVPATTVQQYLAATAFGFRVRELYVFVYWDAFGVGDDMRRLTQARDLSLQLHVPVYYDAEWETENNHVFNLPDKPTPPPAILVATIRGHLQFLGETLFGVYTGRWWWVPRTGDWNVKAEFPNLRLWHAAYNSAHIPPTLQQFIAGPVGGFYAGFTELEAWQYTSDGIDGVSCDVSVRRMENELAYLNQDGSQRIEAEGTFIVIYNQGVAIRRFGSTDGSHAGRESLNFGGNWQWLRHFNDDGGWDPIGHLSDVEGD